MIRELKILLACFIIVSYSHSQIVHFHLEELLIENEVKKIDQDKKGVLWMLTDSTLVSYNGYDLFSYSYDQIDSLIYTSLLIHNGNAFLGTENGLLIKFNINEKSWEILLSAELDAPITNVEYIGDSQLLISTYGNSLVRFDLENKANLSYYEAPKFIYDFVISNEKVYLASDEGVFRNDVLGEGEALKIHEGIVPFIDTRNADFIWCVDYDLGLIQINLSDQSKRIFPLNNIGIVNDLSISEHNEIIGTNEGLFELQLDGTFDKWCDPEELIQNVNCIFIDDENDLWVNDHHTGFWKGALNFKKFDANIDYEIQTILYKNQSLILGTEFGLYSGRIDDWNPQLVMEDINVTNCISFDDYCFVGTYNKGVFVLDGNNKLVRHFDNSNGLSDNAILNISPVSSTSVQIATLAGVQEISILGYHSKEWTIGSPIMGLSLNYVLDIFSDQNGKIYYGLDKSGVKISSDGNIQEVEHTNNQGELGSIYSIDKSTDSTIWFSSENLGITKLEKDEIIDWHSPHGHEQICYSVIPLRNNHLIFVGEESIDVYDIDHHALLEYDIEIGLDKHQDYLNNYSRHNNQVWICHGKNIYLYEQSSHENRTKVNTVIDKIEVNLDQIDMENSSFPEIENNFTFYYSGILHRNTKRIYYSYQLIGFDEDWRSTQDRYVSYPHLNPGEYEFRIKASHDEFSLPSDFVSYQFEIKRAFYKSFWFWSLITLLLAAFIIYLIRRNKRERDLKIELDQKRIETQLINLKSQLNPHFMFNSFNTMVGLIEEDKNKGIEFIEHLTDFYRGVLEIGDAELIRVESEVELLGHYIHLLKERFGEGIRINFKSDLKQFNVPPLSLQMLIENAVKHNVVNVKNPLTVTISRTENYLVVTNNKQLKTDIKTSFGIGLENLKRRYLILSGKDIIVKSDENMFQVKLPIITL